MAPRAVKGRRFQARALTARRPVDIIERMETILLASASPRRRSLLGELGIPFDALATDFDESVRDNLSPPERVLVLAEDKARTAAAADGPPGRKGAHRLVLGADTLVCLQERGGFEQVMGKPDSRDAARSMIALLAGREHLVHTGLALLDTVSGLLWTARSDSRVRFAHLDPGEIEDYLDSGEWEGVAGGYRVQGRAAFHIERIEGSWSGIVGLPMRELYGILREAGCRPRPRGR